MAKTYQLTQLPGDSSSLRLRALFPDVKAAELFAWFSQPDLLVQWWPQTAELEPRLGGPYSFSWPEMNWTLTGQYTAFDPGQRLAFTWKWDHEPDMPMRQVEITFTDQDQDSQILLTHATYTTSAIDQADRQNHLDGWTHFLQRLASVIETRSSN